jgi:histone H3
LYQQEKKNKKSKKKTITMARTKHTERKKGRGASTMRAGKKGRTPAPPVVAKRKKPRFNWRTTARRQIHKAQRGVDMLIQNQPFMRDVRATVEANSSSLPGTRFTEGAMGAMREATQQHLIHVLAFANEAAIHAKRVTVMPKDVGYYVNSIKPLLVSANRR